jgi:hypothetical protein
MKREMMKVSWDEMSFMGMKLIYTVSNTLSLGNWEMKLPTETGLTQRLDMCSLILNYDIVANLTGFSKNVAVVVAAAGG